ncbi:aminoacyl-tRNA hydrolase [Akkermansiaceae bacterium]|nr:aminoacyl-tRNA hydrolase [Akkermansiaceae bacterium]
MSNEAPIKLIVGLGNPGQKYEGTRHNVGFDVLDKLASRAHAEFTKHLKWRAYICKHPLGILMKPHTFMNESGISISAALRFYKWEPENVLIVYDDVALPFGNLRFRGKGSAGGHNGIKSTINHLHSENFPRLKFGIGSAQSGAMVGHVLGKFNTEECNLLENRLATAADAVQVAISEGVTSAANAFNSKKSVSKNSDESQESPILKNQQTQLE